MCTSGSRGQLRVPPGRWKRRPAARQRQFCHSFCRVRGQHMRVLTRRVVVKACAISALLLLLADSGSAQDTQPPTAPPGLTAVAYARSVKLTWSASIDNVSVTGYEVYRNDSLLTTVSGLEYIDAPAPWATLQYKVRAVDGAGNRSEPSPVQSVSAGCWMEQRPANWTNAYSGHRHHVFYVGETVRFDLEMATMCDVSAQG